MEITEMLSYHNDPAIKAKYLARVRAHRLAGNITQGIGWESGRGCAVGCTLENYDHSRYPIELGLPEWLGQLEDYLFEALPSKKARAWPEKFLQAIPVGVDVEVVRYQLAARRMDRLLLNQRKLLDSSTASVRAAIEHTLSTIEWVKSFYLTGSDGKDCSITEAQAASSLWVSGRALVSRAAEASVAARAAARGAMSAQAVQAALSAEAQAKEVERWAEEAVWFASSAPSARPSPRRLSARAVGFATIEQECRDLLELLAAL